jgi:hypothetical protein
MQSYCAGDQLGIDPADISLNNNGFTREYGRFVGSVLPVYYLIGNNSRTTYSIANRMLIDASVCLSACTNIFHNRCA